MCSRLGVGSTHPNLPPPLDPPLPPLPSHSIGKKVEYFHQYERGVDWVFAHCEEFFAGREGFYGDAEGPHKDNLWRFRLLSLAALEAPMQLPLGGATYGERIAFVANDWQTALVRWPGSSVPTSQHTSKYHTEYILDGVANL